MMEMVNTYGQIQLSVRADNETTISYDAKLNIPKIFVIDISTPTATINKLVKAAYLKSSLPFANATVAAAGTHRPLRLSAPITLPSMRYSQCKNTRREILEGEPVGIVCSLRSGANNLIGSECYC
ncbi:hypothetical protein EB796_020501 [Bugula neritina]|uniref:Uncharacterized protein n=1 Tax=Bugula neritina TaxID=10212 RepID=A0A7J7J646_BUGNE|nr:hypothetical protein EB796_020501 [Bugula neritina]